MSPIGNESKWLDAASEYTQKNRMNMQATSKPTCSGFILDCETRVQDPHLAKTATRLGLRRYSNHICARHARAPQYGHSNHRKRDVRTGVRTTGVSSLSMNNASKTRYNVYLQDCITLCLPARATVHVSGPQVQ